MDYLKFFTLIGDILEDVFNDEYVEEIYSTVVEDLRDIFNPKEIGIVEFKNGTCKFKASRGVSYTTIKDIHRKGCHPVFEYVMKKREIEVVKEGHLLYPTAFENPYVSLLVVPVVAKDAVRAIIFMSFDRDFELTEDLRQVFRVIANMVGVVIDYYYLKDLVDDLNNYDPLTGVANFKYFHEFLYREWLRARETNHPFTIALIHVTGIKECNDILGHVKGDELLKFVASIISGNVRSIDFVARYGGAKFVIVFPETEKADSLKYLNRIKEVFESSEWSKKTFPIWLDISVVSFPEDGEGEKELIAKLESRLVEAMRKKGSDIIYS